MYISTLLKIVNNYQDYDLIKEDVYRSKNVLNFYFGGVIVLSIFYPNQVSKKWRLRNLELMRDYLKNTNHLCVYLSHPSHFNKLIKYFRYWNTKYPRVIDLAAPGRLTRKRYISGVRANFEFR